jgi:hypothetical protein
MIKNEPSRDLEAKLKAFLLPLQNWLDYILSQLPEGESSLAEHLRKLSNEDLASSEDKIVDWLVELQARIRSSDCDFWYDSDHSYLGHSLVHALMDLGRQEGPLKQVVDACKQCLVATFEKILGTSLTTNAPETKNTEQQQLESLKRFSVAHKLLLHIQWLVEKTGVFDANEVKLMVTRTAELLNFSPKNTTLGEERRDREEVFFWLVAGDIIPYMMGQKEIAWEDRIRNYPNALEEYLRQLEPDRSLIENFLAVLAQEDGIAELYKALQTQASGSQ